MALYAYNDDFIINSIDADTLYEEENKAIDEVEKLNITDPFYKEKLVIAKVYIALSLMQLENDGMNLKYNSYSKEYQRYVSLSKSNSSSSNVSSIPVMRG